ncbi:hypothetical protein BGW36DRAFT_442920 [Talaromyces proteolyticus]|uniref:Uncharacterized protein n=1 Tax=Talaromyces proteolyticus TaxID=1131652 RepID=A0AAD4KEX3_9EURO|nr:uncharacterized protein BGW36DRAFT_442920 [Talaromyces proteolyticus]KAH8688649.1 hypothetical protein BGW36DRAFT_442920 [Talaromyces proteolyticus]
MAQDFCQLPSSNSAFWLDDSDVSWGTEAFDTSISVLGNTSSSSLQNMSLLLGEYFDRESGAPSPAYNKVESMWFSKPPKLQDHDVDVLNVFLNLFYRHMPKTFPLFEMSRITNQNKSYYILALDAVGGLFCSVNGSFEIVKVKTAKPFNAATLDREENLTVVKTAVREYSELSQFTLRSPRSEAENVQVVLMQSRPSLSWRHAESFCQNPTRGDSMDRLQNLVNSFTYSGYPIIPANIDIYNLGSLAVLAAFSWPIMPSALDNYEPSSSIWKTDFVDLACDAWLRAQPADIKVSSLVLYHTMNIASHANFDPLQNLAHSPQGSAASEKCEKTSESTINTWVRSRHYDIARWHAESLIDCTEKAITASMKEGASRNQHGRIAPPSTNIERSLVVTEAPHIPYAIYYATLILWCGDILLDDNRMAGVSHLARGGHVLSRCRVRIVQAQLLERVLKEVKM